MATTSFTVLYKNAVKFAGKSTDETVFTFTTSALNEADAVRIFKMSRLYHTTNAKGTKSSHFRRFKIVRVYHGDGIHRCTCNYCKMNPTMAPAITVLKSRKPRWMNRNFAR